MPILEPVVASLFTRYSDRVLQLQADLHDCIHTSLDALRDHSPLQLFPAGRSAQGAHSGLLLYLGCWKEAHEAAQDIATAEGSYWHAMLHRIEPDPANARYWFRRVGIHPLFPRLHSQAAAILNLHPGSDWKLQPSWDPFLFIEWCDQARREPKSIRGQIAQTIQMAEWRLLFEWCA